MKVETYRSAGDVATRKFGASFSNRLQPGDLVTLSGPLGAGKTTLVQGIAQGLGTEEDVTSPTFVLIIEHSGRMPVLHLDAYRLESLCYDAIRDAGVADFLDRQDGVKLVEWPERIADFLPTPQYAIAIEEGDGADDRTITVTDLTERPVAATP